MKRKNLILAALVLVPLMLAAAPVSRQTAHKAALHFWNSYRPQSQKALDTMQAVTFDEVPHMYVFVNGEEGFVVVSADDCALPILGYSFEDPFPTRELNPELRYWLSGYEAQIAACPADAPVHPRWAALLDGPMPVEPLSLQNIPALVPVKWNQSDPYNRQCPYDTLRHDRAVVGCVATAMAQIMKRWNHPSCGTGSHSYMHQARHQGDAAYGLLSANFGNTTYLWEQMPVSLNYSATDEEAYAVSLLSYHCGVAVDMMYSPSASGAYTACWGNIDACATNAFRRYFKYESSLYYRVRDGYSDSVWLSMIDADLALGRPILYDGSDNSGGGHAFVLDGSDLDTHYHFNWGWGGYGNGFYAMNNLAPGSGGAGGNATYTFNEDQGAIFGIVPVPETFDTIEVWDTVCAGANSYTFLDYVLPPYTCDTHLRHLDTMYYLHLTRYPLLLLSFLPNGGQGSRFEIRYCCTDTLEMPECPFTIPGYRFRGWCRDRRGNNTIYRAGDRVKFRSNIEFYALWVDSSVSIQNVVDDNGPSLWPNPTEDHLNISLTDAEDVTVNIIDAWGRVVIQRQVVGGKAKISLERLPSGTYTVMIHTAETIYKRQIIKR